MWQRGWSAGALSLVLLVAACADQTLTPDVVLSAAPASASVAKDADAWNYFAVDIATTKDGGVAMGREVPKHTNTVRLERRLDAGAWITRIAMPPDPADAMDPASVASAQFDEDGAIVGLFDRRGRKLNVSIGRSPDPSLVPPGVTIPAIPVGSPRKSKVQKGSRQWLDRFVITADGRARNKDVLEKRHGKANKDADGKSRYKESKDGKTRELVFDETIGGVVEETLSDATGLLMKVTRKFEKTDDDKFVLRSQRIEHTNAGGSTSGVTQEFNNLKVEARVQ